MIVPEKTTFLIVDDMLSIRKTLRENLRAIGMTGKILDAEDVATALEVLKEQQGSAQPIEFIFSDWEMPGATGLEFLKTVRDDPEYKDLPFMLVTTINEQEKVIDAVVAGVSNYLVKPWTLKGLTEKMEAVWKKHN